MRAKAKTMVPHPVVLAVIEAMDMLKNMAIGGIGEDGPTLEELDIHVESTGRPWDDDADFHTAQWAWRKLEQGLNSQNPSLQGTGHLVDRTLQGVVGDSDLTK